MMLPVLQLQPIHYIWIAAAFIIVFIVTIIVIIFNQNPLKAGRKNKKPITAIIGNHFERVNNLNRELEPFGFAYDLYQDIFYSTLNCWQRDLGYCRLYDEACASLSMIIDCEPIRFEYHGLHWMIEFWKGQYGMTCGGEVGIYYTKANPLNIAGIFNGTFYYCVKDEDRINMAFALKKNGKLIFTRSGYHWWLTGFKLGDYADTQELTMDIILELYDAQMCNAFVNALKEAGYNSSEYNINPNGRTIIIHFSRPHTPQPYTRTSFTEYLIQRNNANLCATYGKLTEGIVDTMDKLDLLKIKSPKLYNRILNPGKSPLIFDSYKKIKDYLGDGDIMKGE